MSMQDNRQDEIRGPRVNLAPMATRVDDDQIKDRLLEMQLKMATSSINHEYARIEYDDTCDRERREELLDFMEDCRIQYLEARNSLVVHDPYALADFEADLLRQKQSTISYHTI
ncbi:MAG: hypothetical protein HN337_06245 [Deltaproteobacteria bacterium]|jgi:hypothetical protein|nr:hypothetical protein [Deltaproteobacteria bacterium]